MGQTGHVDSTDLGPSGSEEIAATAHPHTPAPDPGDDSNPLKNSASAFAPLRIALFRDRWIASTVSSVGTWMQDTAGTWLMTVLTTSPLLIALMQTAASLPVLFLGLLAGATADIYERRRLLIFWQAWMLVSVAVLAVLTFLGLVSPWSLLAFTFLLNIGSAMNNPAWQAIVPELVPREDLPSAVTLNAASNNIARALGPAVGGLMVAAFVHADTGAGWVFALNSASFAGVIWILYRWHRTPIFKSALPAERIAGSVSSGLRYLRYAPSLQGPLIRAFCFTFFVSAVWSLLALVARRDMPHAGAMGYGILNGSLGLGAVVGATLLARIRQRIDADTLIVIATLYYVATMLILAFVHSPAIVVIALLGAGFCWTSTMSTLNVSVQLSVPAWVYARALGAYLMTFQGGMALGSVTWGLIAQHTSNLLTARIIRHFAPHRLVIVASPFNTQHDSVTTALVCSAAGLLITLPFMQRIHILKGALPDLTPYKFRRPLPTLAATPDPDDGPVRISIDYHIPAENYVAFTKAIHQLQDARRRDGAIRWGIYRDAADPEHLNETFLMESWLDYLRSRERTTAADQEIRAHVWALHAGPEPPKVSHQIWAREVPDDSEKI